MSVIPFPSKLGAAPVSAQFDQLKKTTSRQFLAAVVTKYPGMTFTADELLAAQQMTVVVEPVGENEWVIVPSAVSAKSPEGA